MTQAISGRPALLLVGDTLDLGGTEGQFTELACRLDRTRWDLEIACVRPEGPLLKPLEAVGLRPWRCGPPSFKSPLLLGAIVALARRIKARGINVLHSFGFYSNILALPAARLAGVRGIVGSQRGLSNLRPPAQRMMQRLSLRFAKQIVVNSDAVKELVVSQGIPSARVTIIPNGVDVARFSPRETRSHPDNGLVIGAMSNLRPEKGLADLIRALGIVRDLGRKVRVVIHGEGPLRGDLETLAARLNLEEWVSLPGSTRSPEAALRAMDVFVLPSVSESCSNALMEAMATGLPVVATAIGGNLSLVEADRTGLLVLPGDPQALARAIVQLVEDRALAARLGERARAEAHRLFGMDQMVSRTEQLYSRSLGAA